MELEIAWYIGSCLLAWSTGFAAGVLHRVLTQITESAT